MEIIAFFATLLLAMIARDMCQKIEEIKRAEADERLFDEVFGVKETR